VLRNTQGDNNVDWDDLLIIYHHSAKSWKESTIIAIFTKYIWAEYCHWWFNNKKGYKFNNISTAEKIEKEVRFHIGEMLKHG
jgi:hypothetical protein